MAKKKEQKPKETPTQKAWKDATGMPMVNQPQPGQGETNFAKDEKKK